MIVALFRLGSACLCINTFSYIHVHVCVCLSLFAVFLMYVSMFLVVVPCKYDSSLTIPELLEVICLPCLFSTTIHGFQIFIMYYVLFCPCYLLVICLTFPDLNNIVVYVNISLSSRFIICPMLVSRNMTFMFSCYNLSIV